MLALLIPAAHAAHVPEPESALMIFLGIVFATMLSLCIGAGGCMVVGVIMEYTLIPIVRIFWPYFGVYRPPQSDFKEPEQTRAETSQIAREYLSGNSRKKTKTVSLWKQRELKSLVIDEDLDPTELYLVCRDPLGVPHYFHSFVPFHDKKAHHFTPLRHMGKRMSHSVAARWVQAMHAIGHHDAFIVHAEHQPQSRHQSEPTEEVSYAGRKEQLV